MPSVPKTLAATKPGGRHLTVAEAALIPRQPNGREVRFFDWPPATQDLYLLAVCQQVRYGKAPSIWEAN